MAIHPPGKRGFCIGTAAYPGQLNLRRTALPALPARPHTAGGDGGGGTTGRDSEARKPSWVRAARLLMSAPLTALTSTGWRGAAFGMTCLPACWLHMGSLQQASSVCVMHIAHVNRCRNLFGPL